jgi:hypothetical protein
MINLRKLELRNMKTDAEYEWQVLPQDIIRRENWRADVTLQT